MPKIETLKAREILDSRGNPTVEVEIKTAGGIWARAAVPSGASTGSLEAVELRDGDKNRFNGKGVKRAVANVNGALAAAIIGLDVSDQKNIDEIMIGLDGSANKAKLGANGILGISLAIARAASYQRKESLFIYLNRIWKERSPLLPAPMMNLINGGCHGANNLDLQEFMILPHLRAPFKENLRAAVEVFHHLRGILAKKNLSTNVGDEGGFAPNLNNHREALDLLLKAIEAAGYRPQEQISLCLDCAASEFYREGKYHLEGRALTSGEMVEYLSNLVDKYPIYSIEDGLAEDDYLGWQELTARLKQKVLLVGDDLFVTNQQIFQRGISAGQANAILIKPNQIGTLTETFTTMRLALKNNYRAVVSHRSGETGDDFIADLAVATGCGHLKAGSASRSDRVEKYNRLLRIEEELGSEEAPYFSADF